MQSGFSVFRRGDTLKEGLDKLIALRDPLASRHGRRRFVAVECRAGLGSRAGQSRRPGGGDRAFRLRAHRIARRARARGLSRSATTRTGSSTPSLGRTRTGTSRFAYRPVRLDTLSNDDVQSFPPAERTHSARLQAAAIQPMRRRRLLHVRVYASREFEGRRRQALAAAQSGRARQELSHLSLGPGEEGQPDNGHVRDRSRSLRADGARRLGQDQ